LCTARRPRSPPPPLADLTYGPLDSQARPHRVLGLIERLPTHAPLHAGGHQIGEPGYFLASTVISGLCRRDEIVQEEIFAPVLTAQRFDSEGESVELANRQHYGLAASVRANDYPRAQRTTAELDFGAVPVNIRGTLTPEVTYGGFEHSGHGKDLSASALSTTVTAGPAPGPWSRSTYRPYARSRLRGREARCRPG
jgi:betaine-aldehyde dehydrogenase